MMLNLSILNGLTTVICEYAPETNQGFLFPIFHY